MTHDEHIAYTDMILILDRIVQTDQDITSFIDEINDLLERARDVLREEEN